MNYNEDEFDMFDDLSDAILGWAISHNLRYIINAIESANETKIICVDSWSWYGYRIDLLGVDDTDDDREIYVRELEPIFDLIKKWVEVSNVPLFKGYLYIEECNVDDFIETLEYMKAEKKVTVHELIEIKPETTERRRRR